MVIYTIQTIKQLRFNLSGKKEIKKRDTGTLNVFLLYIMFINDFS